MKLLSKILMAGIAVAGISSRSLAQSASGVINLESITGTAPNQDFTYNVVLDNTGSTNIGTFWYSWIPFSGSLPDNYYNFLKSKPVAETSPAGWTANIVGPGAFGGGYSIQWVSNSDPLTAGSIDDFGFTTPDNFATVTGNPVDGFPAGYSYVYTGAPEAGDPTAFLNVAAGTSTVPEPASCGLLAVGGAALCARRRQRVTVKA